MLRDGMHQTAVHDGVSPYLPNGIDQTPRVATAREGAYVQSPRALEGPVVRGAPASFDDHYSQAALFYRSLTPVEQAHVVEAFTFELGKVYEEEIKKRSLAVLANVDANLCGQVAAGLGLRAPKGTPPSEQDTSPALSQITELPGPIDGRKIGVIADGGADLAGITKLRRSLSKLHAELLVIGPIGGTLGRGAQTMPVDRTLLTCRSIEFDAIVVAGDVEPTDDIKLVVLLQEAFRHCKTLGAWGTGTALLESAAIPVDGPGIVTGRTVAKAFTNELVSAIGLHRAWARAEAVMTSAVPPATS
jgi:catalase